MMSLKLKITLLNFVVVIGITSNGLHAQSSGLPGVTLEEFFSAAIEYSPELQIASENLSISSARKSSYWAVTSN